MELLDIYDRDGNKKGITVFRGEYIRPDDYILVVHVYIYNRNREFLIQRRSRKKKVNLLSLTVNFLTFKEIGCCFKCRYD